MSQTYIGSTLRTGSDTLTDSIDGGFVVVSQTTTVTTVSAGTATSSTLSPLTSISGRKSVPVIIAGTGAISLPSTSALPKRLA